MKNPITTLHIQNFKTIKDLKVKCKRINIIIGKPNVGKSNLLEAISLLGGAHSSSQEKFLSEYVRYNVFEDLFYDKEIHNSIVVDTDIGSVLINDIGGHNFGFHLGSNYMEIQEDIRLTEEDPDRFDHLGFEGYDLSDINNMYSGQMKGQLTKLPLYFQFIELSGELMEEVFVNWHSPVKKYDFKKGVASTNRFHEFLLPPHGENIFTILNRSKKLFPEIANFFKEYKLKFALRMSDTSFEVQKQVGNLVYPTAYNLTSDTLQRIIFNMIAIHSNKESVLLFEEPEAHSFPPYIKLFAEKVIESKANQFFITTHSPFILNTIVEKTPREDVAVFVASYDKFQTKLTELSQKTIEDMLDYGTDIFFSPTLLK